jgi:hypothetical protein
MPRSFVRAVSAFAAFVACAALGVAPAAASAEGEAPADSGVVEIPYGEPVDVRPSGGWSIDCAGVGALDGVELACTAEGITLAAPFDADWGEQILPVTLQAGAATAQVRYRVRLGPPAAPEVGASAVDVPLPVGRQSLVPLSLLNLTCVLCTDATIEIAEVAPASAIVGVGPAHLSVRPAQPGEITVKLTVTDDAGQSIDAEVVLTATSALPGGPRALHVSGPEPVALGDLVSGDDVTIECLTVDPALACGAEGELTRTAESERPVQVTYRVVDAAGRQALGSVTVDPAASLAPVAPSWSRKAGLGLAVPAPSEDDTEAPSPLAPLTRILQEVPAS